MLHSGDTFEIRARAARNSELRRLAKAVTSYFWSQGPSRPARQQGQMDGANDHHVSISRVA
ncbi:hypothetical protein E1180_08090 [Roseibium denhamense]|uniref:Uncharacterized protein n=1 Tax=Roseibium denhamense TaxID=76305 RepID=A0ABY1NU85_9HYPH|nr:hypothetical protein [Roseibium denhamense]MTI05475.1 hypothetical protein [Roseibium denhamense]SMP18391.1 hypothetical protein SAMN06265374_1904 [Roseibium denhamense]